MFESTGTGPGRRRRRPLRRSVVAREHAPLYAAGAAAPAPRLADAQAAGSAPRLADALAAVDRALEVLAAVELAGEDGRAVLDGTVALQRQANRLAAAQLELLGRADETGAYLDDGAATLAAWLRPRTRLDAGECTRRRSPRTTPP